MDVLDVLPKMKIAYATLVTIAAIFMLSCSGSSEAKTREEQDAEFAKAFGFAPPTTITTINYADLYNRGVLDGAYGQWMSFSFDQASFDKIILGGYKQEQYSDVPNGSASPAWWPKTISSSTVIFHDPKMILRRMKDFSFGSIFGTIATRV